MSKIIKCKCGTEVTSKAKTCPNCGAAIKQPFYKKWWFWVIIVIIVIGMGSTGTKQGTSSDTDKTTTSTQTNSADTSKSGKKKKLSKEEYIQQCTSYNYTDLARNPKNYKNKNIVISGQVIQVQESGKNVVLRVNTKQGEYGIWDDTIYVDYTRKSDDESRILENDLITIYGTFNGIKSYHSVLGNEISIPWIKAEYIDITI